MNPKTFTAGLEQAVRLGADSSHPLALTALLMAAALLPLAMLSATSFVKVNVVLNILRNAVGAGQFPSAAVVSLLSLVLTLHIMYPIARQSMDAMAKQWQEPARDGALKRANTPHVHASGVNPQLLLETARAGAGPLLVFLRKHSRRDERTFFAQAAGGAKHLPNAASTPCRGCSVSEAAVANPAVPGETLFSLSAAFMISELRAAFAIGFLIYLPFLVVDLVVTNILVGLGMMMLSPTTVSLPLKLILFVLADGWYLVCRGLVLSYS